MKENKVFVVNGQGEKLAGIETTPDTVKGKLPTVVLVHGFGVTKHEGGMFDTLAERLAEVGIASYRFDFAGRGESEGDYSQITLTKLALDLAKILDFVKNRNNVDKKRIGIFAQSLGTSVVAALMPKAKAVVLMGSVAHPNEILGMPRKWNKLNKNGISTRIKPSGETIPIGPQLRKDFEKYNLLKSIKKIHCPILFIHGSADDRVPLSEMEAYYKNANSPKEIVIIQGADHGMQPKRGEMYKVAVEWLKKNL